MSGFTGTAYGPVVDSLLETAGCMPLDAGAPAAAGQRLRTLAPADLFGGCAVADSAAAAACLSALWLRHNHLDESHRLSQGIPSAEGSFWHAIMHRREGDYPNAKYWFRRVGDHPVFAALREAAGTIAPRGDEAAVCAIAAQAAWDPFAFVDLCEAAVAAGRPDDPLGCRVQRVEWELLFDHCWRRAIGGDAVVS